MYAFRKIILFHAGSYGGGCPCAGDEHAVAGCRMVTDRETRGYETSSDSLYDEFQRHVRITAGGIQSFLAGKGLPSIKQPGLLLQYLSHKLLRWLTRLFMISVFVSSCLILDSLVCQVYFVCQNFFMGQL